MSFRRYANTDAQEESLSLIEKFCSRHDIPIWFGTCIGKSPQTILLDMTHQGGQVRVHGNGAISTGQSTFPTDEFAKEVGAEAYYRIDDSDVEGWLSDNKPLVYVALKDAHAKVQAEKAARKEAVTA